MKRLLLITLLCVGFAWGSENNASSYPKHWTAEDIEWYETLDYGVDIEEGIYWCNSGSGGHPSFQTCQVLKAFKKLGLYAEAKNKKKQKETFKELCYWLMRMSDAETSQMMYEYRDSDGNVLFVPSELKTFLKSCAKN